MEFYGIYILSLYTVLTVTFWTLKVGWLIHILYVHTWDEIMEKKKEFLGEQDALEKTAN